MDENKSIKEMREEAEMKTLWSKTCEIIDDNKPRAAIDLLKEAEQRKKKREGERSNGNGEG